MTQVKVDERLSTSLPVPSQEVLTGLGAFTDTFASPWFRFGRWEIAGFANSPAANDFVQFCYDNGLVLQEFDWPVWMKTDTAQMFRSPDAIRSGADALQLAQLLTVAIRQNRFVEGGLNSWYESGLLQAIFERAMVLRSA
jgi:hypothetical protein